MLSAFYEATTGRGPDLLKAYLLAVGIHMLAAGVVVPAGSLDAFVPPMFGILTGVGAILYGIGMVLAVGCAAAIFYRAGEGKRSYLLAGAAFGVGAWAGGRWIVQPARAALYAAGPRTTLPDLLPIGSRLSVLVLLLGLALAIWWLPAAQQRPPGRWRWWHTGGLLGLTSVGALAVSTLTGHLVQPGVAQVGTGLRALAGSTGRADLGMLVAFGIMAGSLVASRLHGASPGGRTARYRVSRSVGGGLLMGLSAALVAGDNVLHGLGGVPMLATSSLVFVVGMSLGMWIGLRLFPIPRPQPRDQESP